ncbi:4Fe-4S dicluster domain-containing protein [Bacillus sp. B15-48]|uniref:4Fe-4S dicluster domain-containing protein n=1 Tax=Bacillus sp. B15-48 TaxID=1548601 RepID=UPI00193FB25E|nr:4Fe-4S dicluster domain-containing protein [Bacillus sp. B15-48]MBM4763395.1 4Fe-4S dicluster domain-containing protein [Bacillus sp. B15-48]
MYKQVGLSFNADDCIGCMACEIACKNENQTPSHIRWRKVKKVTPELYLSLSCNHCDNPECFRVCPERAFRKRQDGIVEIDESRCNGCQICVSVCPYEAPQFDPETHKVSKCQMCYPRQDKGLSPACIDACTTGALQLVDLIHFTDSNAVRSLPGFPDIHITNPSIVFYPVQPRKRYFLK